MDALSTTINDLEQCVKKCQGIISTISIYIKFNKEIDKNELPQLFNLKIPGEKKNRRAIYNNFENSNTAKFHGRTCAKIFKNGAQICGCKQWEDIDDISKIMRSKLEVDIDSASVHLFNCVVDTAEHINLEEIKDKAKILGLFCAYDREEYSGLRIKKEISPKRYLTCLMFSSGKVILTGCKQACEFELLYDILKSLIK